MTQELIDEMISELEAMERLVRRKFPGFVHPLIAKLRAEPVQEPVASIYIAPNGEREFDDWKCELPVGRNKLYSAAPAHNLLSELEKDAANLLFALRDAWPYVHQQCTIESKKKRIQALMRKHGDFADLHPPAAQGQPLTDEEIDALAYKHLDVGDGPLNKHFVTGEIEFARAIEAAHGIGSKT